MTAPPLGLYRRRVQIKSGANAATADLEDDFHRFGVDIRHADGQVRAVAARAIRVPWSTCPAAALRLNALVETPLLTSPFAVLRQTVLREHCTHMIDLAALAVTAAARQITYRRYDVTVALEGCEGNDRRTARVERDGDEILCLTLADGLVVTPDRFTDAPLYRAATWAPGAARDDDEMEALFVLSRAVFVAGGRRKHARPAVAADLAEMAGACFTFDPAVAGNARLTAGSIRDFTTDPDALLADLKDPSG